MKQMTKEQLLALTKDELIEMYLPVFNEIRQSNIDLLREKELLVKGNVEIDEIEDKLNNIRDLKANTLKIVVEDLGNDWRKLSTDLAYTNLVLAEANLLLALSNLKK